MRFVTKHRADIMSVLSRNDIDERDIDFIKRRGRINIVHRDSNNQFAYLRKKETRLDPFTQQWDHREWYRVKVGDHKEIDIENWVSLVQLFEKWCKNL